MGLLPDTIMPLQASWVMTLGHGLGLYSFSFAVRISYLIHVESRVSEMDFRPTPNLSQMLRLLLDTKLLDIEYEIVLSEHC
jgi:hypothetical protein